MKYFLSIIFLFLTQSLYVFGQKNSEDLPEYGLVLSGGGAVGFAHAGALLALEEAGIKISVISGASMGSIIAAMYAYGYSPQDMINILKKEKLYKKSKIFNLKLFSKNGLSNHKKIERILNNVFPIDNFDSLKIFFALSMTNFIELKTEYAFSGDKLKEKILASISIPSIFEPQIIDGIPYIDGGVMNNLPIEPIRDKCKKVIMIDVVAPNCNSNTSGKVNIGYRAGLAMMKQSNIDRINLADFYIPLEKLEQFNVLSFEKYKEIIQIGYECMKKYLEEHPELK